MRIDEIINEHKPQNRTPKTLDDWYNGLWRESDEIFYPDEETDKQMMEDHRADLKQRGLL